MRIWVDADACPKVVKEILFRAAERAYVVVIFVANKPLRVPPSAYIKTMQVAAGFDVADNVIAQQLEQGDLVVTADIPLAAEVLAKGGHALNPRGELYTKDNIQERLAMRNLLDELRGSGVVTGGPSTFSHSDRHAFARQLDRFLTGHANT
jgi:uncharacterized protein YaiI (UPF0178 family)